MVTCAISIKLPQDYRKTTLGTMWSEQFMFRAEEKGGVEDVV